MPDAFDVLVDSDAFVGWFYPNDVHHPDCEQVFSKLRSNNQRLVTTSFVVAETATVLSHRQGQLLACRFLKEFIGQNLIDVIHITEALQQSAIEIFLNQQTKGTSMTDCANVAVMRWLTIPRIFSFDKVYSRTFGLKTTI